MNEDLLPFTDESGNIDFDAYEDMQDLINESAKILSSWYGVDVPYSDTELRGWIQFMLADHTPDELAVIFPTEWDINPPREEFSAAERNSGIV